MKYLLNTYFLIFLLFSLLLLDIVLGSIDLFDLNTDVYTVLVQLRLPRVLTAAAVGSILSISGLVLQILFRNPLAGPYVLGISSAASLFAAIGIMGAEWLAISGIMYTIQLNVLAIIGAIVGLLIILIILRITTHITVILLAGIMLSQLYGSIQSILSYLSNEHAVKTYAIWTMGSIQNTSIYSSSVLMVMGILMLISVLMYTRSLMIYITGEEAAQVMGINIQNLKTRLIIIVAIMVGLVTAYCGPIALVGMSIPVLVRIMIKSADVYKWITHSFLLGAIAVVLTDVINQIAFDGAVPINILISMWGVPLMIWILLRYLRNVI